MDELLRQTLISRIKDIFAEVEVDSMSQYQKRQAIFSYLCDSVQYDFSLLDKIAENERITEGRLRNRRSPVEELHKAVFDNVGICSSISQYYKLLLEQVGISSYCVVCDNGMPVKHQIAMVYDESSNSYSFDDITSVIVGLGNKSDFFDYDISKANRNGQGKAPVIDNQNFVILAEEYIDYLVDRRQSFSKPLTRMPINIRSVSEVVDSFVFEK